MKRRREEMAICKPRRETEQILRHNCQKGSTLPASSFWTLVSRSVRQYILFFLCYFVMAAQAN